MQQVRDDAIHTVVQHKTSVLLLFHLKAYQYHRSTEVLYIYTHTFFLSSAFLGDLEDIKATKPSKAAADSQASNFNHDMHKQIREHYRKEPIICKLKQDDTARLNIASGLGVGF